MNSKDAIHLLDRKIKPYHFLEPLTGPEPLDAYFKRVIDKAPHLTMLQEEAQPVATASWNDSPWDTRNIKYKTARVSFLLAVGSLGEQTRLCKEVYREMEHELVTGGYEYILYRVNASDLPGFGAAQDQGFQVVDGLLTLAWEVDQNVEVSGVTVRPALDEDMSSVRNIARTSFIYDRFHTDFAIPDSIADELHASWIQDSHAVNADERVIVAEQDDRISGFLSYSINEALSRALGVQIMTLILVATAKTSRNQGLAKRLIRESMSIARKESFQMVLVGTQLRNVRATRLYETLGFRVVDTNYTFRKLLKGVSP